jgi:hypothetical protein
VDRITLQKSRSLGYVEPYTDLVGKMRGLNVTWGTDSENSKHINIEVVDPRTRTPDGFEQLIMSMLLEPAGSESLAYEVSNVNIGEEFRGFGVAPKVYRYILKKLPHLLLKAGSAQSPGGRYIWYMLAQYKDIVVYVQDSSEQFTQVRVDSDEKEVILPSGRAIYDTEEEYCLYACAAR